MVKVATIFLALSDIYYNFDYGQKQRKVGITMHELKLIGEGPIKSFLREGDPKLLSRKNVETLLSEKRHFLVEFRDEDDNPVFLGRGHTGFFFMDKEYNTIPWTDDPMNWTYHVAIIDLILVLVEINKEFSDTINFVGNPKVSVETYEVLLRELREECRNFDLDQAIALTNFFSKGEINSSDLIFMVSNILRSKELDRSEITYDLCANRSSVDWYLSKPFFTNFSPKNRNSILNDILETGGAAIYNLPSDRLLQALLQRSVNQFEFVTIHREVLRTLNEQTPLSERAQREEEILTILDSGSTIRNLGSCLDLNIYTPLVNKSTKKPSLANIFRPDKRKEN